MAIACGLEPIGTVATTRSAPGRSASASGRACSRPRPPRRRRRLREAHAPTVRWRRSGWSRGSIRATSSVELGGDPDRGRTAATVAGTKRKRDRRDGPRTSPGSNRHRRRRARRRAPRQPRCPTAIRETRCRSPSRAQREIPTRSTSPVNVTTDPMRRDAVPGRPRPRSVRRDRPGHPSGPGRSSGRPRLRSASRRRGAIEAPRPVRHVRGEAPFAAIPVGEPATGILRRQRTHVDAPDASRHRARRPRRASAPRQRGGPAPTATDRLTRLVAGSTRSSSPRGAGRGPR